MKYNPYHGYGTAQPWLWYSGGIPRRIRTRSDWRYDLHWSWYHWGRPQPWLRPHSSAGSVYEKKAVHRRFRQQAKYAIWRELGGDDNVSHHIIVSGDYLD